jgi:hypothetical protein
MPSKQQFSPLCDLHHVSMQRVMLEEDSEKVRSYHVCERRDCTRIFHEADGYADLVQGGFDNSRASVRMCPLCGTVVYLAEVDHSRKVEIWECPQNGCDFSKGYPSPSAR